MNITSSYQVRIVNCSVNLNETVCIYRKALAYLIGVVNENWNAVKRIDTGNLEQQRYIDKLVHSTKNHEAKYPDFDKLFYKYPSYLRRATITVAIGAVSSYRSNLANWEVSDKRINSLPFKWTERLSLYSSAMICSSWTAHPKK